jgi:hypothetical protein
MDNVSEAYSFNTTSGSILLAQDPFNVTSGEKARSNNNIPHAFSMNLNWQEPWLRNNRRWYGLLAGGWSVGIFEVWQAGRPFTISQQSTTANVLTDTAFNGGFAGYDTFRPFLSNPSAPENTVGQFNSAGQLVLYGTSTVVPMSAVHFIYNNLAADKAYGTPFGIGRNTETGPRYQRADISIYKTFDLTERFKLTIRGEAQNAFNHTVYPIPSPYPEQSVFLNVTAGENTGSGSSLTAGPRIIKLGAKITF